VLQVQVLPELDTGFKHANALTVSQQERVTVSQSEPIVGVVANDRAECGDRNFRPPCASQSRNPTPVLSENLIRPGFAA